LDSQRRLKFTEFHGGKVLLKGAVFSVWLPHHSPSIAVEDAVAWIELDQGEVVPGQPKCRAIEVKFDEHGVLWDFVEGQRWIVVLSETGELVNLYPEPNRDASGR
jgi:hypothetical protein